MSRPHVYHSRSTPMCFEYSAEAHECGDVGSEEYLDRMLAHLRGIRHPEDITPMLELYDPLSMNIQDCLPKMNEAILTDTSDIKNLFLACWIGELQDVMVQTPLVLASLTKLGISRNIFEALLCLACLTGNPPLLSYLLTLKECLLQLSGSPLHPLQRAISRSIPSVGLWSILLDNGLYTTGLYANGNIYTPLDPLTGERLKPLEDGGPNNPTTNHASDHIVHPPLERPSVDRLALSILRNDLPSISLLEFLISRGYNITGELLYDAMYSMNPPFIRYLLTCTPRPQIYPYILLSNAVRNSPQVCDILLSSDLGIDINYVPPNQVDPNPDPFRAAPDSSAAIHEAAQRGRLDVVQLLLERGAKSDMKDGGGRTASSYAEYGARVLSVPKEKAQAIVELLRDWVPRKEGEYVVRDEDWVYPTSEDWPRKGGMKFVPEKVEKGSLINSVKL